MLQMRDLRDRPQPSRLSSKPGSGRISTGLAALEDAFTGAK